MPPSRSLLSVASLALAISAEAALWAQERGPGSRRGSLGPGSAAAPPAPLRSLRRRSPRRPRPRASPPRSAAPRPSPRAPRRPPAAGRSFRRTPGSAPGPRGLIVGRPRISSAATAGAAASSSSSASSPQRTCCGHPRRASSPRGSTGQPFGSAARRLRTGSCPCRGTRLAVPHRQGRPVAGLPRPRPHEGLSHHLFEHRVEKALALELTLTYSFRSTSFSPHHRSAIPWPAPRNGVPLAGRDMAPTCRK